MFCALKPGRMPTMVPSIMPGRITHHSASERPNSSTRSETGRPRQALDPEQPGDQPSRPGLAAGGSRPDTSAAHRPPRRWLRRPDERPDAAHAERPHAGDQDDEQAERRAGPGQGGDEGGDQRGQASRCRLNSVLANRSPALKLPSPTEDAVEMRPMWKRHMASSGTPTANAGGARLPDEVGGGREVVDRKPAGESAE